MSTPDAANHILFCPEPWIERAVCAVLTEAGIVTASQRGAPVLSLPRVDVRLGLGAAREKLREINGHWMRHSWDSSLQIDVSTKRDETNADLHAQLVGQVRYVLGRKSDMFGIELSPYHEVAALIQTGSEQSINAEDDCDVTSMTFSAVVAIR